MRAMNMGRRALLSGMAALGVATAILAVSVLSGVPVLSNLVITSRVGAPGTLTVLLTDPPSVPAGVTAVFVTYSDLSVHLSEAGNESGWTTLSTGGMADLLSTVNISQTIASVAVPTGDYNALRLNVTSASVTSDGNSHPAYVVNGRMFIPIAGGGIEVNDSKPSASIIDISPLVLNVGNSTSPAFVIRPTAVAWPVPSDQITGEMQHDGFRFGLAGRGWWERFEQNSSAGIQITSASLSSSSLNVSVKSADGTRVRLVVVSPVAVVSGRGQVGRMPMMLSSSEIFVVEANGSLIPLRQFAATGAGGGGQQEGSVAMGLMSAGYDLTAGSSVTLSYSGPIDLGGLGMMQQQGVSSGQQYLVNVISTDGISSLTVLAK